MKNAHLVLQGKGGVGKSLVASLIAQYKAHHNDHALCIDTDPVNATLAGYKQLNVERIELISNNQINTLMFDQIIALINESETDIVIDNGASSFTQLSHYFISNDIPSLLAEIDVNLVVHTVITGGQAFVDTLQGFSALVDQFPNEVMFVVWINPFWGKAEANNVKFEQMRIYTENKNRISSLIHLPEAKHETFSHDFKTILQKKLTFDEAIVSPEFSIMTRQRLKMLQREIFSQMSNEPTLCSQRLEMMA